MKISFDNHVKINKFIHKKVLKRTNPSYLDYSSDMGCAFEIVFELKQRGIYFDMLENLTIPGGEDFWSARFRDHCSFDDGQSAAHAICMAACIACGFGSFVEEVCDL